MKRAALLLAALLAACGDSMSAEGDKGGGNGPYEECHVDADCPSGLVCRLAVCVSPDDERPPEQEETGTFQRPAATATHVFALATDAGSVAIIDPLTLQIEAVVLPEEPLALAVHPQRDAVLVLSRRGEALTLLERRDGAWGVTTQKTPRRFSALSLSPDGDHAVLWTPDGSPLDGGAEGIVAVADVEALLAGAPAPMVERAAGRRHTDVVFHGGAGTAEVAVVGKDEVAILDLASLDANPAPDRIRLPVAYHDLLSREVIAAPDGRRIFLRSFTSPDLAILDVADRALGTLTLPAPATDLDLSADGALAVAALRSTLQVAWFPVPEALADPAAIRTVAAGEVLPGQVALSADARFAAIFTTTEDSERFGLVDLEAAAPVVEPFDWLEKWIRTIGIAPDGRTAIVVHRPNPGSTQADPYEREVDQDEGYSLVDLSRGFAQLKRTDGVPPLEVVFAADGRHAAVTLRDDRRGIFRVDAVDLETLVSDGLSLASAPSFAGPLPSAGEESLDDRIWVTQDHPAGRISFVDLAERTLRTATGYELNSEID